MHANAMCATHRENREVFHSRQRRLGQIPKVNTTPPTASRQTPVEREVFHCTYVPMGLICFQVS